MSIKRSVKVCVAICGNGAINGVAILGAMRTGACVVLASVGCMVAILLKSIGKEERDMCG